MSLDVNKLQVTKDDSCVEFLREAYKYAFKHSDDPNTKVGAITVNGSGKISFYGVNHFPENVKITEERLKFPEILNWIIHAEQDIVNQAAAIKQVDLQYLSQSIQDHMNYARNGNGQTVYIPKSDYTEPTYPAHARAASKLSLGIPGSGSIVNMLG